MNNDTNTQVSPMSFFEILLILIGLIFIVGFLTFAILSMLESRYQHGLRPLYGRLHLFPS
jgi:hypothetical protein